jgi:hypothetical protein
VYDTPVNPVSLHGKFTAALAVDVCYTVTYLINMLPGNRSVNTVQHETTEEAVFYVDPTDVSIDLLDSNHVICVYCR